MDIEKLLNDDFPGLFEKIKMEISKREGEFDGEGKDSHLWEHSFQVACLANKLAEGEGCEALIPVLTGLFHDSGKFKDKF